MPKFVVVNFNFFISNHLKVQDVIELDEVIPIKDHKVTTENVDSFNWKSGVEFYL